MFGEFTLFKHLVKKVWRMNRSAKGLLIVATTLGGFSLVNYRQFAKFTKLSNCQTFPLYSIAMVQGNATMSCMLHVHNNKKGLESLKVEACDHDFNLTTLILVLMATVLPWCSSLPYTYHIYL